MERKKLLSDFSVDSGDRSFIATITSNAVDRDREVLLPEGMNSKDFEKNPVIFWNHDTNIPIGQSVGMKRQGNQWVAKGVLAQRPKDHVGEWFPDTVLSLMQQRVVRGISAGLMPKEFRKPTSKDKEMFGDDVQSIVVRWNLLEFSVTPLPANQDALVSAVSKGLVSSESAKKLFGVEVKGKKPRPRPKPKAKVAVIVFHEQAQPRKPKIAKPSREEMIEAAVCRSLARMSGKIYLTDG